MIDSVSGALSEWIVARQFELRPDLAQRYGEDARGMWRNDVQARLRQLAQAVALDRPELFFQCAAWSKVAFCAREVAVEDLQLSLECTASVLRELLPESVGAVAAALVDAATARLPELPESVPSELESARTAHPLAECARRFLAHLLEAEREAACAVAMHAARDGTRYEDVCLGVVCPALREVGRLWHVGEISVADEHVCTAAAAEARARLFAAERERRPPVPNGRVAVVTAVYGDLHELPARMLADFLELDGWRTVFLGANTPGPDVVTTLLRHRADLLAISASTRALVGAVRDLVAGVRQRTELARLRVLVGGAPFAEVDDLWRLVGADGSARDAGAAVVAARQR